FRGGALLGVIIALTRRRTLRWIAAGVELVPCLLVMAFARGFEVRNGLAIMRVPGGDCSRVCSRVVVRLLKDGGRCLDLPQRCIKRSPICFRNRPGKCRPTPGSGARLTCLIDDLERLYGVANPSLAP